MEDTHKNYTYANNDYYNKPVNFMKLVLDTARGYGDFIHLRDSGSIPYEKESWYRSSMRKPGYFDDLISKAKQGLEESIQAFAQMSDEAYMKQLYQVRVVDELKKLKQKKEEAEKRLNSLPDKKKVAKLKSLQQFQEDWECPSAFNYLKIALLDMIYGIEEDIKQDSEYWRAVVRGTENSISELSRLDLDKFTVQATEKAIEDIKKAKENLFDVRRNKARFEKEDENISKLFDSLEQFNIEK